MIFTRRFKIRYVISILFFTLNVVYAETSQKILLGQVEKVQLVGNQIILNAKIDTGAFQSSLSAKSIKIYRKQTQAWVDFIVPIDNKNIAFSAPFLGYTHILKRRESAISKGREYEMRPTVALTICIANKKQLIQVNLIDRSYFTYPFLLGSEDILKLNAIIDVKQKYLTSPNCN